MYAKRNPVSTEDAEDALAAFITSTFSGPKVMDERQTEKKCNMQLIKKCETEETYREDRLCARQLFSFTTALTGE